MRFAGVECLMIYFEMRTFACSLPSWLPHGISLLLWQEIYVVQTRMKVRQCFVARRSVVDLEIDLVIDDVP